MVKVDFIFFFCLLIFSTLAENYDCYPSTTPSPSSSFDCKRDIVIVLDGTPYMKSKDNVKKEIQFIQNMLSNWTFGDNGVNVAFGIFGFNGQTAFTHFFTTFKDCQIALKGFNYTLSITNNLQSTSLNTIIHQVSNYYGNVNATYPHRPGIEPRLIAFSSTTNVTDILLSKQYFDQLYNNNYDTVLGIIYADVGLYSEIRTLKTIDMQAFDPDKTANISETIATALCYHDVRFTPSPCPSTVQSTTPLATSLQPSATTTTSAITQQTTAAPGTAERECGCTIGKIWLDIVFVLDNSQTMTQEGFSTLQSLLDTVVYELTLNISGGWASRIAVVTFNSKATIVANFTRFTSPDDFEQFIFSINVDPVETGVNIFSGLQAASDVIKSAKLVPNRRSVVVLFTSAYNNNGYDDPIPMANGLKADNIKLITVAFAQRMPSNAVYQVGKLAYPGFNLTNNQVDFFPALYDKFCQANCFCSDNWLQYKQTYADVTSRGYGICLYYSAIIASWQAAKFGCRNEAINAYLASEFTAAKHSFNVAYAKNQSINDPDYHIGLSYVNGTYQWEQANGQPSLPLSGYTAWNVHFPNQNVGNCVRNTIVTGKIVKWSNENCHTAAKRYLCQVNTCDTDNYCGN